MKLTIISSDGAVYVDGEVQSGLVLNQLPNNVHALQWNEDSGWIEFVNDANGIRQDNEKIKVLPEWATLCLDAWNAAKIEKAAFLASAPQVPLQQPTVNGSQTL